MLWWSDWRMLKISSFDSTCDPMSSTRFTVCIVFSSVASTYSVELESSEKDTSTTVSFAGPGVSIASTISLISLQSAAIGARPW